MSALTRNTSACKLSRQTDKGFSDSTTLSHLGHGHCVLLRRAHQSLINCILNLDILEEGPSVLRGTMVAFILFLSRPLLSACCVLFMGATGHTKLKKKNSALEKLMGFFFSSIETIQNIIYSPAQGSLLDLSLWTEDIYGLLGPEDVKAAAWGKDAGDNLESGGPEEASVTAGHLVVW